MNVDRLWWNRTARIFGHILKDPDARVLDLCCGTGDMTFALYRHAGTHEAEDGREQIFPLPCSTALAKRAQGSRSNGLRRMRCICLSATKQFDLVTSAFGFRNLANYDAGLREIYRVLRPNGEIGILDFSEPKGAFGDLYRFYFKNILPKIGTMISGVEGPYAYLPASVERFPEPERNAGTHEGGRIPRSQLDALHVRHRRPVAREEIVSGPRSLQRSAATLSLKLSCNASSTVYWMTCA